MWYSNSISSHLVYIRCLQTSKDWKHGVWLFLFGSLIILGGLIIKQDNNALLLNLQKFFKSYTLRWPHLSPLKFVTLGKLCLFASEKGIMGAQSFTIKRHI